MRFREVNIQTDRRGEAQMRRLNPSGGIPTFDIDGTVVVGFDRARLRMELDRAVTRRVR